MNFSFVMPNLRSIFLSLAIFTISFPAFAAPVCTGVFSAEYANIASFNVGKRTVFQGWRSQIWKEEIDQDFLVAWRKRHGEERVPAPLLAEYYLIKLQEAAKEPRIYVPGPKDDEIVESVNDLASSYRSIRGYRVAYLTRYDLRRMGSTLAEITTGVDLLIKSLSAANLYELHSEEYKEALKKIVAGFRWYEDFMLGSQWAPVEPFYSLKIFSVQKYHLDNSANEKKLDRIERFLN